MQVIYENKDITDYIEVRDANIIDNSGEEMDSIELIVNNSLNQWSKWNPEKDHTLALKNNGFSSGIMYIDEISQYQGSVTLKARPVKQESKQENTKSWDNIRFLELVQEFCTKHNLTLKPYGLSNFLYERINQFQEADFSFLNNRCLLEGYILKITDNSLVIFDEKYMENTQEAVSISRYDIIGDFSYKDKSSGIYGACTVSNNGIKFTSKAADTFGPTLKINDVSVYDIAEAERYSANLLRFKNKYEKTMSFATKLNANLAAANIVSITDCGIADGKYFAYKVIHKLVKDKTLLFLRQIPEGY